MRIILRSAAAAAVLASALNPALAENNQDEEDNSGVTYAEFAETCSGLGGEATNDGEDGGWAACVGLEDDDGPLGPLICDYAGGNVSNCDFGIIVEPSSLPGYDGQRSPADVLTVLDDLTPPAIGLPDLRMPQLDLNVPPPPAPAPGADSRYR